MNFEFAGKKHLYNIHASDSTLWLIKCPKINICTPYDCN